MKKILDFTDISDECKLGLHHSENSRRNAREKTKTFEEMKKRALRRRSKKKCNKNTTKDHAGAVNTKENNDRDIDDDTCGSIIPEVDNDDKSYTLLNAILENAITSKHKNNQIGFRILLLT